MGTWPRKDLGNGQWGDGQVSRESVNLPSPADHVGEPSAEGSSHTSTQGCDEVDRGSPLGNIPQGYEVWQHCQFGGGGEARPT